MKSQTLSSSQILAAFKEKALAREVDTTNQDGYNGYKGKIYKIGSFQFFDTFNYHRFGSPTINTKYLYGSTVVSKEDFINRISKIL